MNGKLFIPGILTAVLVIVTGCGGTVATPAQPAAQSQTQPSTQPPAPSQGTSTGGATVSATTYAIVPQSSTASYSVREKFLQQNSNVTAVGKTSAYTGELKIKDGVLMPSTITVDLRTLTSDKPKRDDALKTAGLETNKYPYAVFTINGVQGAATALAEGKEVAFKLAGNMKLRDVEKPLTFDAVALLQGDTLTLKAVAQFNMTDFKIVPPNVLNMISVDEQVQMDVQVTAKKR